MGIKWVNPALMLAGLAAVGRRQASGLPNANVPVSEEAGKQANSGYSCLVCVIHT